MIYTPEEDSYLLLEYINKKIAELNKDIILLEMGVGSGMISIALSSKVKKIYAVDVDEESIDFVKKEIREINTERYNNMLNNPKIIGTNKLEPIKNITLIKSDLFNKISKNLRFDIIAFNPPYLPDDKKIEKVTALHGGKQGNEIIINFLEQAKEFLALDGEIILLFSSLSKRNKILKKAKHLGYDYKLIAKKRIFFEQLYVYCFKPKEYLLAKGHRGKIYLFTKKGKKYIRKVSLDSSTAQGNIENEARFNKLLNKYNIAPQFVSYDKKTNSFIREYVAGENIDNYFLSHNKEQIINILEKVFMQLLKLDELRINKFELTNPYKHIILNKNIPVMIDFERARFTEQPKNITQFLQYISSNNIIKILQKKKIIINKDKIKELSKKYKQSYDKKLIEDFIEGLE